MERIRAAPDTRPAGARLVHMAAFGFPRADSLDDSADPASDQSARGDSDA
jgi:hypothetical protein